MTLIYITNIASIWETNICCCYTHIPGFDPWVGKIPWRRKWQPTPVLLPGESHGGRSLVGYSPWGRKESDTTERLHFTSLYSYTQSHHHQLPHHSAITLHLPSIPTTGRHPSAGAALLWGNRTIETYCDSFWPLFWATFLTFWEIKVFTSLSSPLWLKLIEYTFFKLRCHAYTIKFTVLKYIAQRFLVFCATITIKPKTISISSEI